MDYLLNDFYWKTKLNQTFKVVRFYLFLLLILLLLLTFNFFLSNSDFFTTATISPLATNFASFNLAVKSSPVKLLISCVIIYLL